MVDPNRLCLGCMRELPHIMEQRRCPFCNYDGNSCEQNCRYLAPGTVLAGKYLVGKVLGEGGGGITYIGFELNMELVVAIKEYFPKELANRDISTASGDNVYVLSGGQSSIYEGGMERFVTEARNLAVFYDQEGIVSVKNFFYENNTAYIVMEFIEGENLNSYLKKKGGKLSEKEALQLMKPVISILRKVHQYGVIHRDLSPDNIMISKSGQVKLIDFGAARMSSDADIRGLTVILKHGYAPEEQYQTHGQQGPWTDVYGVCACLYRMIAGEIPESAIDRLFEDRLKSLTLCNIQVTKRTEQALMRGLELKKEKRIQSMDELYQILYDGKRLRGFNIKRQNALVALTAISFIGAVAFGSGYLYQKKMEQIGVAETENERKDISHLKTSLLTSEMNQEKEGMTVNLDSPVQEKIVVNQYQPAHAAASYRGSSGLLCKPDGTVESFGDNSSGKGDVLTWRDITAVATSLDHSLGLKAEGTVVAAGSRDNGRSSVESWSDIVAIAAGNKHSLGLKQNGTVVSTGDNELYQCQVGEWTDMVAIAANYNYSVGIQGDGTVLCTGGGERSREIAKWPGVTQLWMGSNYLLGGSEGGKIHFIKILDREDKEIEVKDPTGDSVKAAVSGKEGFIQVNAAFGTIVALKDDGTVFVYDYKNRAVFTEVLSWTDIQAVILCDGVIGLKKDGTIERTTTKEINIPYISGMKEIYVSDEDSCLVGVDLKGNLIYNPEDHARFTKEDYDESWFLDRCKNVIHFAKGVEGSAAVALTKDGKLFLFHEEQDQGFPGPEISVPGAVWADTNYRGTVVLFSDGTVRTWEHEGLGNLFWDDESYIGPIMKEVDVGCGDWTQIKQVWAIEAGNTFGVMGLTEGGMLKFSNGLNMGAMMTWDNIRVMDYDKVSGHAAAICYGGKVLYYGDDSNGQSGLTGWENVEKLCVTSNHTVGLMSDGTVVAAGRDQNGQCDVGDWEDVVFISASDGCTLGIKSDGNVLIAGIPYEPLQE